MRKAVGIILALGLLVATPVFAEDNPYSINQAPFKVTVYQVVPLNGRILDVSNSNFILGIPFCVITYSGYDRDKHLIYLRSSWENTSGAQMITENVIPVNEDGTAKFTINLSPPKYVSWNTPTVDITIQKIDETLKLYIAPPENFYLPAPEKPKK